MSYVCSQTCQRKLVASDGCRCTVCGTAFELQLALQAITDDLGTRYFCSLACRERDATRATSTASTSSSPGRPPRRIAVFNHKGGTGKTTTAVNVAAGLAERGLRVLLVDCDAQGNVGVSLGVRGERTLYHVLVLGVDPRDAAIPVRSNLEVLTSNETLAAAELYLASRPARDRVLRDRMASCDAPPRAGAADDRYDVIVVDCSPSLSLLNQNALVFADAVLVPASCDYLSLVGVRQVLRTIRNVNQVLKHPVRILGALPTFYDSRNKIARESVETLRGHFGQRCLAPIRVNTKLREAPSARQTIFEYAPTSHAAEDYRAVVEAIVSDGSTLDQDRAPALAVDLDLGVPRTAHAHAHA
ncbi:MAG: ParA family protein [Deltaproteobacteria bacterium]|nr:ParA family protein [Deltaproteobacteria bacterium]